MVDREKLALERTQALALTFFHRKRIWLDAVLDQLGLDKRQRQIRPHQGNVRPLAQQIRHCTDVVFVRVRQHDRLDGIEARSDVVEVRQDQIDAGLFGVREQHPAVDDQQPPAVFEDGHVATDFTEAAQGDDP